MKFSALYTVFLGLILTAFTAAPCAAGDFGDDMPIDEPINDSIELERNTSYIFVKAMGRGRMGMDDVSDRNFATILSLGSVVVAPGAEVGDITLIFDSDNNIQVSR